jgi:hypothetical protein
MQLPLEYFPDDARPFYHPIGELQEQHVDPAIWHAVSRINQSGWVWTLESCEGHGEGKGTYGWQKWPMIRLAVHRDSVDRMFGALHRAVPVAEHRVGALRLEVYRHVPAPMSDWFECRVLVTLPVEPTEELLGRARNVFDVFAESI